MYTIHLKNLDIFEVSEEVKNEIKLTASSGKVWYVSDDLIINLSEVTYIQKS